MNHTYADRYRWIAITLIVAVVLMSAAGAFLNGRQAAANIREQLSERSQSIANALGPDEIAKLAGQPSDADTQTYKNLKATLAKVKTANPDARSIYLIGQHNNRLFFYVDSEKPGSRDYSEAAEWYDDGTDADNNAFTTAKPFVEGPATDSYGTFISGLAPIFKPGVSRPLAILGIDIGANTYWQTIAAAASIPTLIGVSTVLVIIIFEWQRRRNAQLMAVRSELISVASHELRTPITGIRWAAESIQTFSKDEKVVSIAKAIQSTVSTMETSTQDIMEISRVMSSRSHAMADTELVDMMHEIVDGQELTANQRNVTLAMDGTWPPSVVVNCDRSQLKRAIYNVIGNAIKYATEGTPVLIWYREDQNTHSIMVADHGIGIPADEQKKVFRGFYRATNAVASKAPGSGLGLYLVRAVMERHGGTASFVSEENKGTTFKLTLPKKK